MLDAEKWAKAKGFNTAYLCSINDDFYKKCGYSRIKSGYFRSWWKKEI